MADMDRQVRRYYNHFEIWYFAFTCVQMCIYIERNIVPDGSVVLYSNSSQYLPMFTTLEYHTNLQMNNFQDQNI